jgi:hypothetical protein
MKEVIIKYKDSRVLALLKSLAVHFNFSVSEKSEKNEFTTAKPGAENKAADFVSRWAGFLKNSDTDESKYDYLSQKYK